MKLTRIAIFCVAATLLATEPNEATKRWWAHVVALANDGMEGRDTGSAGYLRRSATSSTDSRRLV